MKTIRLTEEKRVRELIELASKVFKISERTIRASTRKQKFHLIRVAISNVARSQGIHYNSISKGLKGIEALFTIMRKYTNTNTKIS